MWQFYLHGFPDGWVSPVEIRLPRIVGVVVVLLSHVIPRPRLTTKLTQLKVIGLQWNFVKCCYFYYNGTSINFSNIFSIRS